MNTNEQTAKHFSQTEAAILLKYGLTLDDEDLGSIVKQKKGSIQQIRSDGYMPIKVTKTFIGGKKRGKALYDFRDVAAWWDKTCGVEILK